MLGSTHIKVYLDKLDLIVAFLIVRALQPGWSGWPEKNPLHPLHPCSFSIFFVNRDKGDEGDVPR
jgi:hypothetical protein